MEFTITHQSLISVSDLSVGDIFFSVDQGLCMAISFLPHGVKALNLKDKAERRLADMEEVMYCTVFLP
jgi:hypothetical protein